MKKHFLLSAMLLICTLPIFAEDFESNGIYYNILTENTVAVTFRGTQTTIYQDTYTGTVSIPTEVIHEGITYSVTSIAEKAFRKCSNLTAITIPQTITSIARNAFTDCSNLTSVILNTTTAINTLQSVLPGVTSVTFGENIETIPARMCYNLTNLTEIIIPKSVISIGDAAFARCPNLSSITVEEGNPLYTSKDNCLIAIRTKTLMAGCSTSVIPIDGSVTSIGASAFEGSGIASINIPSTITSFGDGAFADCATLEKINYTGGTVTSWCNISMSSNPLGQGADFYLDGEKITDIVFECDPKNNFCGCTSLQTVSLPNTITTIAEEAFSNCINLHTITIPNSVTEIGNAAFWGCLNLQTITLPESLIEIYNYIFKGCSNLVNIFIPNSVTAIGAYVFDGCTSLQTITIPNSVETISVSTFANCTSLQNITIPSSVTSIGKSAFSGCTALASATIKCTTPPTLGATAFPTATKFTIPCGTTDAYYAATEWTKYLYYEEAFLADWSAVSADEEQGTVVISQSPTSCDSQTATFEVHAAAGYRFASWQDGNTDNPRTVEITDDIAYTASFEVVPITITTDVNDNEWGIVTGAGEYAIDATATLTAIPAAHYQFTAWQDGNTDNPRTVIVSEDATYTATFAPLMFTIATAVNNASWGTVEGAGVYQSGTSVTITATASEGAIFNSWSDGNTDNPRTVEVSADATYTAIFVAGITDLQLRTTKVSLYPGDSYYLNTIVTPADADKSTLLWSSDNEEVVSIVDGFATAHNVGKAIITVTTDNKILSATCEIIVSEEGNEEEDGVVVNPNDESVDITWSSVEGAAHYVLVIYADEAQTEKICTLTFDAHGYLTNIHFQRSKPAVNQNVPSFLNFTVTGLQPSTTYSYSMSSYDEESTIIESIGGSFTTTAPGATTGVETPYIASPDKVRKVMENGTIYILRGGKRYMLDGREVK